MKRWVGVLALALIETAGCTPSRRVEARLTDYIPAQTDAVVYLDLDRLRSTALAGRLPVPEQLREASTAMVVLRGSEWAAAARGRFAQAPAGGALIGPGVVAEGAADLLDAMRTRPAAGAALLAHAPTDAPLWVAALGRATLPLSGNLINLNRLLHQAEYTTIGVRVGNGIGIEATAQCATPAAAQHLEQNIRALASLGRVPSLAVSSQGTAVHVTATVSADSLPELR